MMTHLRLLNRLATAGLIFVAILAAGFTVFDLPIVGHDAYFHLTNLSQFFGSLSCGVIIPRWTPENFVGFGSATFYFYPPLLYFLSTPVLALCNDLNLTLNLVSLLVLLLAVYCFTFSARAVHGANRWCAAAVFGFAPYLLYALFYRSALSESLALAFFPLLLLGFERVRTAKSLREQRAAFALSALAWTLIALSSIPSAAIAVLTILALSLTLRMSLSSFLTLFGSGVLAIACTTFLWYPALLYRNDVHLEHIVNFSEVLRNSISSSHLGWDLLPLLLSIVLALYISYHAFRRSDRSSLIPALAVLQWPIMLLQIPVIGHVVFDLPLFNLIQLPIRLLGVTSFFLAAFVAQTVEATSSQFQRSFVICTIALCGCVLLWTQIARLTKFHEYTEDKRIAWNAVEYLPAQVNAGSIDAFCRSHRDDPEVVASRSLTASERLFATRSSSTTTLAVSLQDTASVIFHRFFWRDWELRTNAGKFVPLASTADGRLQASLPKGTYRAELRMSVSSADQTARWIALVSIGAMAILLLTTFMRRNLTRLWQE